MDTDNDGQQQTVLIDAEESPAYYAACMEYIDKLNAVFDEVFLKLESKDEHLSADK
mgnify:CR=1 FL=1